MRRTIKKILKSNKWKMMALLMGCVSLSIIINAPFFNVDVVIMERYKECIVIVSKEKGRYGADLLEDEFYTEVLHCLLNYKDWR